MGIPALAPMLTELRIANFTLIERLHLQFQPGFTVFTGETGAGKSLLIEAIGLLVGGRASIDQIRTGEEESQLEASFHLPLAHPLRQRLCSQDLIDSADQELIIRRVLSRSGRHRAYLNGNLCPLRVIEELGGTLVDIHGQHEQQSLLAAARQLDAVDGFGGIQPLRARYGTAYQEWRDLAAQLEVIQQEGRNRDRLEDLLRFQLQEIEQAGVSPDEEESLQGERQRLIHAHRLRELAESAYADIQADEEGVLVKLGRVGRLLGELTHTDPAMGENEAQSREAAVLLKDLAAKLRAYADHMEADPERLSKVEDRLDIIQKLKKKYGGSVEAFLATGVRLREELQAVETHESRVAELSRHLAAAKDRLAEFAKQLTRKRREASKRMALLVAAELAALKMEQTVFDIHASTEEGTEGFGLTGRDRVDFVISSNVGEPHRPLSRIASGGELSRIMLALKTVLAETDHVPVLVFDEIDTGVGGAVAAAMGTRLKKLGSFHQVFCVTHLPQVASQADHHWLVEKGQDSRRTTTSVKLLNGIGREGEIARMLGGEIVTKKVRETAAELIAGAKKKG